jgi:uridylate kinase
LDKVVVSIGGSILIPGNGDSAFIKELAAMIEGLSEDVQMVIVCGGGRTARYYADTGRALGGTDYQLDVLGIGATRLNAQLLSLALGSMPETVPETAEDAARLSSPGRIVVMGGTVPGHTTDAVAMMVARELGAERVVNATSVDAVYSEDPKKNPCARRFECMTIEELGEVVYKDHRASECCVFDPLGVRIAREGRIDICMVDGRDLPELRNAILGRPIRGTYVRSR